MLLCFLIIDVGLNLQTCILFIYLFEKGRKSISFNFCYLLKVDETLRKRIGMYHGAYVRYLNAIATLS